MGLIRKRLGTSEDVTEIVIRECEHRIRQERHLRFPGTVFLG